MTNQLYYKCKPIHSINALSLALGFDETFIKDLANKAEKLYRRAKPIIKPDGSIRQPFDAIEPLKEVHRRLKARIFSQVVFPYYLTGSLKGKDYLTNASLHTNAKIIICEDITNFFPSTSSELVYDIWRNFFGFSEEVSTALTLLTTKDGMLPQGAITSSFLANLVFWRIEPSLQAILKAQGVTYSRYVDDITVSSRHHLSSQQKTDLIASIYGMLAKLGFRAKRRKHETYSSGNPMFVTKLQANKRAALSAKERAQIRASVYQLEQQYKMNCNHSELTIQLNQVSGRVAMLSRLHPTEGKKLAERVKVIRSLLTI